jgi:hypothetical protein
VTVTLQDAVTRTVIATGTATFATAAGGYAAAEQAGDQLIPAITKIRAYQAMLRDTMTNVAIFAHLDVSPDRAKLNVGQTTPVKLTLADCDGVALTNRSLRVKAVGGTVSPSTVETNDEGRATVTFRATRRGPARVQGYYVPYTTTVHQQNGAYGEGLIDVDDPLTNVYAVTAKVTYAMTEAEPSTNTGPGQTTTASATANGYSEISEWTAGNPLSGSDHLVTSTVTGGYSLSGSSVQTTSLGQGYMCVGGQNEELTSADATDGGLSIDRRHGKISVSETTQFKAPLFTQGYASQLCPTPGATYSSPAAGYNIDLQNMGPHWTGHCSGGSKHISCQFSYANPSVQFFTSSVTQQLTGSVTASIRQLRTSETR